MAKVEILLPAMGEGIIEATITKWLVEVGDKIEEGQSIVEVATDKVDSEIPSPEDGVIDKLLFDENDIPKIGDTIAIINTNGIDTEKGYTKNKEVINDNKESEKIPKTEDPVTYKTKISDQNIIIGSKTPGGKFLSPLVRKIAEEENLSLTEIDGLNGSGNTGRITKKDILSYINTRTNSGVQSPTQQQAQGDNSLQSERESRISNDQLYNGKYEIVKMDRMRKLIAEHMVQSKQISPHVTSFIETDVTNLVNWRNKNKVKFLEKENTRLTFTPLFIEAVVKALKDFPMINVSVDGDKIIKKKNINIGVATALPSGNLIVPVIKDTDRLNLIGIADKVNDLASRARNNKLKPDEVQGGTFTITNFGTFGNTTGTPIINQPQVAILGVGAIIKKPAIIETETGDAIAIRHMMILSLAYDHRVIDGALGGMFLKRISDHLQNFDIKRNS